MSEQHASLPPDGPGQPPSSPPVQPRRRWWRWVRWPLGILGLVLLILGLLALPALLPTRVLPPAVVDDAVTIFLLDHGRTTGLALPVQEAGAGVHYARYVYGEWQWYALGNTGILRGAQALLWPTRGTLGSERLTAADEQALLSELERRCEHVHPIRVQRQRAAALRQRLDELHEAQRHTQVGADGLQFVHHPQRYTWWHNSNHVAAEWLEELGCEIRGLAYAARWRVGSGESEADVEERR
jgi:hypothetical protein